MQNESLSRSRHWTSGEQAGLLEYVDKSKAGRASTQAPALTNAQACEREPLAVELAPFRVSFAGHKFDRDEANAR